MLRVSKRLIDVSGMRDVLQRRIPVMSLDSKVEGPVVWLTGCIHGDEPGGAAIIQDVFRKLRATGLECGAVYALPLINSTGFENVSRFINSEREDLNRCFPGDARGTAGQRIARRIFDLITETEPALVIDLHNDWIQSVPYVVLEAQSSFRERGLLQETLVHAVETALLIVQEPESAEPTTLTGALIATGIPALTLEAGGACGVVETNVRAGKAAVLGVLRKMKMIADDPENEDQPSRSARVLEYSNQPLCTSSGIIRFSVRPGDAIVTNQELGRVYSVFGALEESLRAVRPGYVLGVSDHARALPGSEVIAIAEFAGTSPVDWDETPESLR